MPFVQISLYRSRHGRARQVGDRVHQAMVETLNIPADDKFQILTEHSSGELVYDPSFLGIDRTDGIVMIQITLATGRSRQLKTALFARIAELLAETPGIRPQDIFVTLVEASAENFSFGNGEAQFAYHLPPHLASAPERHGQ
ncbi:tautomerase family protein [Streptosporangium sp. OZ121]|uniref:tautomerase family protein n=1 Tax=Streptosporangium sp. OZ121 TaxID=3444183 RepID=UPI003F79F2A0